MHSFTFLRPPGAALYGSVRQDQQAARGERVPQQGDRLPGVVLVLHEVEHGHEQKRDRTIEVEQPADLWTPQDRLGGAEIGRDDGGPLVTVEDGPAVGDGDRVVVDVDHSGGGVRRLGYLVDVAEGGDAGTDVQELIHTLADGVAHGAPHEGAVGLHDLRQSGKCRDRPAAGLAVGLEVVRAAQVVVVDPGHARHRQVDSLGGPGGTLHQSVAPAHRGCVEPRLLIVRSNGTPKRKTTVRIRPWRGACDTA